MPKLYQKEYHWSYYITLDDFDNKVINCQKSIEISNASTNKIHQALVVNFSITRNPAENLLVRKSFFDKITDKIKNSGIDLLMLSQLNIFTHFCVYFTNCHKNVGAAILRLHTNYNEIVEATYNYEYNDSSDPVIIFDTNNRFTANKIFGAFIEKTITKIEFLPTEDNTFDRIYFDIRDSQHFELLCNVQEYAKKIGFQIKGY